MSFRCLQCSMVLESGKAYRAKTAAGNEITFTVIESGDGDWSSVELDEGGVVEPNVWLNTSQLLWISAESKRKLAISKAADEIIDVLENSVDQSYVPEAGRRSPVVEDHRPSFRPDFPGTMTPRGCSARCHRRTAALYERRVCGDACCGGRGFLRVSARGPEAARPRFVVSYGPQQIMRRIHRETVAGGANADAVRARAAPSMMDDEFPVRPTGAVAATVTV